MLFLCLSTILADVFEDANTRTNTSMALSRKFEGVYVDRIYGLENKRIELIFIFSSIPTAYIDYYDTLNNVVVLEFYDIKIGESLIDSIVEYPIITTKVEETTYDLNKDVTGFKPDVRDIFRFKIYLEYQHPYTVTLDEFNTIKFSFVWSEKAEDNIRAKAKHFNKIIIITFLSFGICAIIYSITNN